MATLYETLRADIIVAMNNKPVKDGEDLVSRVAETPVGTAVTLTIDRDGKRKDLKLTIMDRAEVFKDRPEFADLRREAEEPAKGEQSPYKFGVKLHALATWWDALEAAQKHKYFDERGLVETKAFLEAPEQWSANHGGRPPAPRSMLGR